MVKMFKIAAKNPINLALGLAPAIGFVVIVGALALA